MKKKAISALRKEVVESIAKKYGIHIKSTVTLRAMVRAIRTHVKPSDTQARGTAKDNWTKLLKASARGTAAETWADLVFEAYNKAVDLECPFTAAPDAQHDFVNASSKYAPSWSERKIDELQNIEATGGETPSFEFLVTLFKTYLREAKAYGKKQSVFPLMETPKEEEEGKAGPTFKGKAPVETPAEGSSPSQKKKKCPIYKGRSLHSLDTCYLIHP